MSDDILIGVDVGGTKIECAALTLTADGHEVLARKRVPTEREQGYRAIVDRIRLLVAAVEREVGRTGASVGMGVPGAISRKTGSVKNSNTTCLNGMPFRQDVSAALGRDVAFDNDANCFVLAETLLGAARPFADGLVFGVIMGTGVGGGLCIRRELWSGLQDIAGEWGHHAVFADRKDRVCYCGRYGCLELFASGPALEAEYLRRAGSRLSLEQIAAIEQTDTHAAAVLTELVEAFGRGLANVIDILDPSAIVLGGGVSNLSLLYSRGRARVADLVFNDELLTPIVQASLGDSAGVLGAALLPLRERPPATNSSR